MKGRFVIAAGLLAVAASAADAQVSSSCPAGTMEEQVTQDACQKAVDLFAYMAPQLGTVIAGGNATPGQGGTLGGIGNFVLSIRANAVMGSLPNVQDHPPATTGAQQTDYQPEGQVLGLPAVDAAVGVFGGLPLGLTRVGGVDLLLSAWYLPEYTGDNVAVTTESGGLKIGYGARLGLLQESLAIPGVSFTWMTRGLPVVNIVASAGSDDLEVNRLDVQTTSWRLVASKNLMVFGLAAGYGKDTYESSASVVASSGGFISSPLEVGQDVSRTNLFANVTMNLFLLKIVGEIGQVSGGDIPTYNTFGDTPADASRLYGSVGLRFGF